MNSGTKRDPSISYASVVKGFRSHQRFTEAGKIQQYFSLPFNFIEYILKNPKSPTSLRRLYQSCKYFYSKFPIFIFSKIQYNHEKFWKWKSSVDSIEIKNPKALWWFENDLELCSPFGYQRLLKKMFRCSISRLYVTGKITINLAEFEILVSENGITSFYLSGKIINDEENVVPIDIILSKLPKLEYLYYYNKNENYSSQTIKNLCSQKSNEKLKKFYFCCDYFEPFCVPQIFLPFFKKRCSKSAELLLISKEVINARATNITVLSITAATGIFCSYH